MGTATTKVMSKVRKLGCFMFGQSPFPLTASEGALTAPSHDGAPRQVDIMAPTRLRKQMCLYDNPICLFAPLMCWGWPSACQDGRSVVTPPLHWNESEDQSRGYGWKQEFQRVSRVDCTEGYQGYQRYLFAEGGLKVRVR